MRSKLFLGSFLVLMFLGCFVFGLSADAWWDTEWTYRQPVTINNSSNANNLTNYQVKISLTSADADFWAHVADDGSDIRILDSDDAVGLNHWVKSFDYTAQTATIWVKVSSIAASSSEVIYLYFGNSDADAESSEDNTMESSPQTFWSATYNNANLDDQAWAVAFLSDGSLVVGGKRTHSDLDWMVRKYSSSGQVEWTDIYDSGLGQNEEVLGIAVDSSDNIIACGRTDSGGDDDWYIRKYDSSGNVLWSANYDSGGNDVANGVAVDSSNNVIVTGYITPGAVTNWYTRKYDSNGSLINDATYNSGGNDYARAVVVDSDNNIIVVGSYVGANTYFYVKKYNSSLVQIWDQAYDKGTCSAYFGVDTDSNNNIFLGGIYQDGNYNWLIRKVDSDGNLLWDRLFDSGNGTDWLYDVAVDSLGNVVGGGYAANADGVGDTDWYLRKYDGDGNLDWSILENDVSAGETVCGVSFDANDDLGAVGYYDYSGLADNYWKVKVYGERQYTNPAPTTSLGSLEKTKKKNFDNYIRFGDDSEGIRYNSAKTKVSLKFLDLPKNPSQYGVRIKRLKKWPNNILKKKTVKYYWKIRTNLYKAKGKKPFKLRLFFKYKKKSARRLKAKRMRLRFKQGNYVNSKWVKKKNVKLKKKNRILRTQKRRFKKLKNWFVIKQRKKRSR